MAATPPVDVLLVSMPFGIMNSPSLALAILQARLNAAGIRAKCRHFTIDYAAGVGLQLYDKIASGFPRNTDLLGEWIFSHAVSRKTIAQQLNYLTRTFGAHGLAFEAGSDGVLCSGPDEHKVRLVQAVLRLAETVEEFVEYVAEEILRHAPRVVGFTTVFQQNSATIAVAARLRQLDPSVKIVLGGANCEGPMGQELARTFPCMDVIVSGEADLAIVPLVKILLAGEDPKGHLRLQPYVDAGPGSGAFVQAKLVPDLDSYSPPSFDDYFQDLGRFWKEGDTKVQIPLETSRGCWWGMRNHCTFCGLNGSSMAFRSRKPDDALREIVDTAARYPGTEICFVDNIMDYRYYDQLLPELARLGANVNLFYEIKSNVTKAQVRALKEAGVKHVQPGIESLSDQVLRIMKKGVKAIHNIQLLKWCMEYCVRVDWNVLWGFPGEHPGEYDKQALLVPLLSHLQPPVRASQIRLDRFSPNFVRSFELGFFNVRPYQAYGDVYEGVSRDAVFNLSYFFEADGQADSQLEEYTRKLSDAVQGWRAAHATSTLVYLEVEGRVVVIDSRSMLSGRNTCVLDGLEAQIFLVCDRARSASSVMKALPGTSLGRVTEILNGFCERGTMWFDGEQYLSLAVSLTTFLESRGAANMEAAVDSVLPHALAATEVWAV
jgi:ribosomal peptide maturation radical SAM protein 1